MSTELTVGEQAPDFTLRDSTGTERAPSRPNSARLAASSSTLIDSNSIPRTERNSFSFRQLVHPGCQNAFNGGASAMLVLGAVMVMPAWLAVGAASTCPTAPSRGLRKRTSKDILFGYL